VNGAARRLSQFKQLLEHAHDKLALDFGFVLWDGTTVPDRLDPSGLAVLIGDEGAIAGLVRRPKLDTLLNLWVSGRFDIRNGSILDLVAHRPKVRTRKIWKSVDKRLALSTALKFLFASRGGPWPLEAIPADRPGNGGTQRNKENVSFHYDEVPTPFYQLWLDPEMLYTCGYFTDWGNDLATAQRDHLDITCRKLRLKPGETLLDIGCGWGGLACYAAEHFGVRVHGVTLSKEQLAYAQDKVARAGLADQVTLELRDFTTIDGAFDKAVALGILEHFAVAKHQAFFQKVHQVLKPSGLFLNQAIVRRRRPTRTNAENAAINRYIFPGGELDNIAGTLADLELCNFEVRDVEGWREHNVRTTRFWHDRLAANRAAADAIVGAEKSRLFLAYLAGFSVGFDRGSLGVYQTLAVKRERGRSGLPPTRGDLYG
jgi:cyclopropane-fatty-acyl-phospholipid synthase